MNVTVEISNDCDTDWVPADKLCESWIQSVLQAVKNENAYCISLRFVQETEARELNNQYRGVQSATNVLSFPSDFPANLGSQLDYPPLGDIVLCPEVVEHEAQQQGKPLRAHWAHLLIHGVLHLLGYDHDTEDNANDMENLEIKALERLGFPNPYLIG